MGDSELPDWKHLPAPLLEKIALFSQQQLDPHFGGEDDSSVCRSKALQRPCDLGTPGSMRQVCRSWRAAADQNVEQLVPSMVHLPPAPLTASQFPKLKRLYLFQCVQLSIRPEEQLYFVQRTKLELLQLRVTNPPSDNVLHLPALLNLSAGGDTASYLPPTLPSLTSLTLRGRQNPVLKGLDELPTSLPALRAFESHEAHWFLKSNRGGTVPLQLTGLTRLYLTGTREAAPDLAVRFKGLLELGLPHCKRLNDEYLEALVASFPRLQALDLSGCDALTNEGMRHLARLTALRRLSLAHCYHLTGSGLTQLAPLTKLEWLDLTRTLMTSPRGLSGVLALHTRLTSLSLQGCRQTTDEGFAVVCSLLPNLVRLDVSSCGEVRDHAPVSRLTRLRELHLAACRHSPALGVLAALPALAALSFHHSPAVDVTPEDPAPLGRMSSLTWLDVSRRPVTDAGDLPAYFGWIDECIPHLAALPGLTFLDCSTGQVAEWPPDTLSRLNTLPALRRVNISPDPEELLLADGTFSALAEDASAFLNELPDRLRAAQCLHWWSDGDSKIGTVAAAYSAAAAAHSDHQAANCGGAVRT